MKTTVIEKNSTPSPIKETANKDIDAVLQKQKSFFATGKTRPLQAREDALRKLRTLISDNEQAILQALMKDLNKSEAEAYITEIAVLKEEIKFILKNLHNWAKPKKVKTALTHIGTKGIQIPEPYGVSLIIAPWNYPFQLALSPLLGAIAAGNTAILKPSELTPTVAALLSKIINEHFDPGYIHVIEGGVETNQYLLKQRFDYIFFTGSVPVGKIVMEAAAKNLTPLTLELGGKSPCIVHEDADISLAAKRIAFGKVTNAGQTCIAPDYLFVHKKVKDAFIQAYKQAITEFYGDEPIKNETYGKIVNQRHFDRVSSYLSDGDIIVGGKVDEALHKIEPTILVPKSLEVPVMQEEIFGPIMPMIEYENLEEVVAFVNSRPKPLALYLFSNEKKVQKKINTEISYGGGCINDTLLHVATPYLPFGGVGESGLGSYHGESSFKTFSHYKSVLKQTTKFDFSFRYPNAKYGLKIIKKLMG
ncbi:aldehyde dehydrogenase family protein [Lottiidibacillus patelloidae]|uniref:Aldehyde dehydrogenase n=1 Tax=Lottiidibacillus patelloidae TaxID=2670334 RepID=A0A263BRW0_9BACI|nr:aldehyde dehydrogenase [Lottiidibacillus patelloidae]OZM56450.1 aldehyde dehydrogenase family protein [Lottiidibacillus patelloidae]